jgi:hypothetical protein
MAAIVKNRVFFMVISQDVFVPGTLQSRIASAAHHKLPMFGQKVRRATFFKTSDG